MRGLWLYDWLSKSGLLNYRAKIMLMAFISTHIPLIALVGFFVVQSDLSWRAFIMTVGIVLAATLVGTALILLILHHLLRPVVLTSRALRQYRESRENIALPTHYADEVGILMADADATIEHLERTRDALEHIDEATGLPNRRKLLQLFDRRASLGLPFTVGVVRFSNFSRIAEVVDLARANKAAASLATRLEKQAGPGCVLARIGQSDFALFWNQRHDDIDSWLVTSERMQALIDGCSQTLPLDTIDIKPELLCGAARFPEDANEAETLLDHAIAAAARATISTPIMPHSEQIRRTAFARLTIEHELRQALEESEFLLHYQPVIDVAAGKVVGAEALIRWHHPERGQVFPSAFIPAAEASGLIEPMGQWVMQQASEQLRKWNQDGPKGMRIAVNLSARQFHDPNLSIHIATAINRSGIEPGQIEVELTETSAMLDFFHTQYVFSTLRELGVSIAIDDFGTGYASMSYLRKLPFNTLKIDREFVTDVHRRPDGQAICQSLIALSKGLDLNIIVEGTEKAEEVRYLTGAGCRFFQGYYFAKPLPAREFEQACTTIPSRLTAAAFMDADRYRAVVGGA